MSYEIEFDQSLEIVTVKYIGSVSLGDRLKAVSDVCVSYSHLDPLRLLIDVIGLEMDLSHKEQKYFAGHLATNKSLANAKVAVLHEKDNNPNIVIDTLAFNEGYQLVQFDVKNEALSWLKNVSNKDRHCKKF